MENKNYDQNKDLWWRPALIFYAKTTGWVIFPLILAVSIWKYFGSSLGSQVVFFILILLGFLVTCFGIYREIKIYKINLEKAEKEKENLQNNG